MTIKKYIYIFLQYIRMSSKSANFGDKKIEKSDFYKNKKVAKIDDFDVNKTLVFKEEPYWTKNSFKYFIGYNDNDIIRPLCIKLSQMTGYVRTFESNTTMVMVLCVQIFKVKKCLKKKNHVSVCQ